MALEAEGFLVRLFLSLKCQAYLLVIVKIRHLHIPQCATQVEVGVLEGVIKNVEEFQFLGSLKV